MVMLFGGLITVTSGVFTLWKVRRILIELGQIGPRPIVDSASTAFRSFRKTIRGVDPDDTAELDISDLAGDPPEREGEG